MTEEKSQEVLDWEAERKTGLGGTDMPPVLGVCEFGVTPADIFDEKTGRSEPKVVNRLMERGIILEPIVADWWSRETGRDVRRQPMRRHREYPWMIGNIDRQVLAGNGDETELLEIYIPGLAYFQKTKLYGLHNNKNVQGQHYLAVYGYPRVHYAVVSPERWEMLRFTVDRSDSFITEMIQRGDHFWKEYVLKDIRPPEEVRDIPELPEVSGEVVVWDKPEQLQALFDLAEAHQLKADSAEIFDNTKEAVQELMGDDVVIEGCGHRVYWRPGKPGRTFDNKALAKAHPSLDLEPFWKPKKASRPFKPYFDVVEEE